MRIQDDVSERVDERQGHSASTVAERSPMLEIANAMAS